VAFDVYLDLPPGTPAAKRLPHFAGSINYYDAVIGGTGRPDAIFSFDITDVARALRSRGLLKDATALTIVPSGGTPAGNAAVDSIQIVEQ
jgi:hypothetical protein